MKLKVGTRIYHRTGRYGTVVGPHQRHNGYPISLDEPRPRFEPERFVCRANHLTPVDPDLHAAWEACWPAFEQPNRAWARAMKEEAA